MLFYPSWISEKAAHFFLAEAVPPTTLTNRSLAPAFKKNNGWILKKSPPNANAAKTPAFHTSTQITTGLSI